MVQTWLARATAALGLLCWVLKDFAIAAAGKPGASSLEDPLFWAGIVLLAIACVLLGRLFVSQRSARAQAIAVVLGVAAGAAIVLVCTGLSRSVTPHSWGWFRSESGLTLGAAVIAVFGLCVHDIRRRVVRRRKAEIAEKSDEKQSDDADDRADD